MSNGASFKNGLSVPRNCETMRKETLTDVAETGRRLVLNS